MTIASAPRVGSSTLALLQVIGQDTLPALGSAF